MKKEGKCECCDKKKEDCECDADCPNCDCKKKNESFTFDKFMDAIVIQELHRRPMNDSPNRERARRHQERPLNRIKIGGPS